MENTTHPSFAVITGCDSGIGQDLCQLYLEKGWKVAAGYLNKPPLPQSDLHIPLSLDLRSEASIAEFTTSVHSIIQTGTHLTLLVHNAGIVSAAPVEHIPMQAIREVFEVNLFGIIALTRSLIPALIESRGAIALNGSLAGRIGLPFFSPYVSSKFALEGFTESLRREMAPFGVRCVIFEPAAVATPIWNNSWQRIRKDLAPLVSSRYRAVFESAAAGFVKGGNNGMPSRKAASFIMKIMLKKHPRARYVISKQPLVTALELVLPTRALDFLIGLTLGTGRLGKEQNQ